MSFDLDAAFNRADFARHLARIEQHSAGTVDSLAEDVEILVRIVRRLEKYPAAYTQGEMEVALRLARDGQSDEQIEQTIGSLKRGGVQ